MSKSFLIDTESYIIVKCYFVEEKNKEKDHNNEEIEIINRTHIPFEAVEQINLDENQVLRYAIGSFRKPTYKTYCLIKTKSLTIDVVTKTLYTHPTRLQNEIINYLLFAIQDDKGQRTDITDENKKQYFGEIDPIIIIGLCREFMKKSGISFDE